MPRKAAAQGSPLRANMVVVHVVHALCRKNVLQAQEKRQLAIVIPVVLQDGERRVKGRDAWSVGILVKKERPTRCTAPLRTSTRADSDGNAMLSNSAR